MEYTSSRWCKYALLWSPHAKVSTSFSLILVELARARYLLFTVIAQVHVQTVANCAHASKVSHLEVVEHRLWHGAMGTELRDLAGLQRLSVMRTPPLPSARWSKAGAPVRSSKAITPKDHVSSAGVDSTYCLRNSNACTTSGAAYARVKHREAASPTRATQPKSMMVQRFCRGSHITLPGLRSRCTYPASCMSAMRLDMLERTWMIDQLWFPNNNTQHLHLLHATRLKAVSNPVILCLPCIKLAANARVKTMISDVSDNPFWWTAHCEGSEQVRLCTVDPVV